MSLTPPALLPAILLILLVDERIGHAGDVVADDAGQRLLGGFFAVVARQVIGLLHPVGEEFPGDTLGVFFLGRQRWAVVKIFVEKVFQPAALLFNGRAEGGKSLSVAANIFQRMHASRLHTLR